MDNRYLLKQVSDSVLDWLNQKKIQQCELARYMKISTASMTNMLKGKIAIPQPRFFQIITMLKPTYDEINRVFSLYVQDAGLPPNSIKLECAFSAFDLSKHDQLEKMRSEAHAIVDELNREQLKTVIGMLRLINGK